MTQQFAIGRVPTLTLGWRLKMALGDTPAHDMADLLGVSRATVSRWMNDTGAPPKAAYLKQWALITGVDYGWLDTGTEPTYSGPFPGSRATRQYEALHDGDRVTSILRLWGDTVRAPLSAQAA